MAFLLTDGTPDQPPSAQTRVQGVFVGLSFFFLVLLEYNCFTMLLVSAVQWSELPICIHISPPS